MSRRRFFHLRWNFVLWAMRLCMYIVPRCEDGRRLIMMYRDWAIEGQREYDARHGSYDPTK